MEIRATNDFAASVPDVFAMLTDPVFLRAVCLASSPEGHEVAVDGLRTTTRRVLPAPSGVARLTGPTLTVIDEITWDAEHTEQRRTGTALITVEGMPVDLVGTVVLAAGGRGAVVTYSGELSVRIPLLGPGLAKQAAPALLGALDLQQQVGGEYLAG